MTQFQVDAPPEDADALARRVDQTLADLASDVASLRRRMTETRETLQSLFAEPHHLPGEKSSLGDERLGTRYERERTQGPSEPE